MKRKAYCNDLEMRVILNNCIKFLEERHTLYVEEIAILLSKALEGVEDKKDLTASEQDTIKNIREMIKGL